MLVPRDTRDRRGSLLGNFVDCYCLCCDLFLSLSLVQGSDSIVILPHSGWGGKCGGPLLPCCERTDLLTTVHCCAEKEAADDFEDPYFFSCK